MSDRRVKVRVALTLTVDPDTWESIYGLGTARNIPLLREDVRCYAEAQVYGSYAREEGAIVETKLVNP